MWIAGHLTVVEGRLQQMLHGTPNPVHHWKPLFDWGSEPVDDPAAYPPFDEVVQKFKELRAQTHAFLDEVGEEGLRSADEVSAAGLQRVRDGGLGDHHHRRPCVRPSGRADRRPGRRREAAIVRPVGGTSRVLTTPSGSVMLGNDRSVERDTG